MELDLKKMEKVIFILENIQLENKEKFISLTGQDLLRRTIAMYKHTKRFFLEEKSKLSWQNQIRE